MNGETYTETLQELHPCFRCLPYNGGGTVCRSQDIDAAGPIWLSSTADPFVVCTGKPAFGGYNNCKACLYKAATATVQTLQLLMPGRGDEAFQAVWSPAGSRIAIIWKSGLPPMDLAVGYMSCNHVARRWVSSQAVTCAQKYPVWWRRPTWLHWLNSSPAACRQYQVWPQLSRLA